LICMVLIVEAVRVFCRDRHTGGTSRASRYGSPGRLARSQPRPKTDPTTHDATE
jgi:hypothetical protein